MGLHFFDLRGFGFATWSVRSATAASESARTMAARIADAELLAVVELTAGAFFARARALC